MNAAAAALVVLNGRQAFDPRASLFAHNEPGFWYDPSDLSSMYQDSAGTTPVTAVEQAVGLVLDKSKGLVIGPELFVNPNCTDLTGFAAGGTNPPTLTFDNGVKGTVTIDDAAARIQTTTITGLVVGKTYLVTVTANNACTKGNLAAEAWTWGTIASTNFASGVSTRTFRVVATATSGVCRYYLGNQADNDGNVATITQHSVRELAGNHAIQPGATNRPILRSRYNLLTYSEQFDNAAWTKTRSSVTANAAVAPDGTSTADKLIEDSSALATHETTRNITILASTSYTISAYIKADTRTWAFINFLHPSVSDNRTFFDLANGVVGTNPAGTTATITGAGGGWYRCSVTRTAAAGQTSLGVVIGLASADNTAAYTGDGTSGLFVWGADLRSGNDIASGIPSYQRIAAATDYDTVGFPVYLAFDGSDDSLYTGGNVDFSATDKMTVFAGVTKLSDAAIGFVVELSADVASNNGTIVLAAPRTAGATNYRFISKGTALADAIPVGYAAPITNVLVGIGDIGTDVCTLRIDGVQAATDTTDQGTGNYGSYPLYIGRRNNASLPFNGRLYQLIGRGAATSAALIAQAERWVAGKQGRAL